MKILVIGGVAAGTKTAAKLKREDRTLDVILLTKDRDISYAGCGLPYYVGGLIESSDALVVNTPEKYAALTGVTVHTGREAVELDSAAKTVKAKNLLTGETETYAYDRLVLAVGASPVIPPIEGVELKGVFKMRTPEDAVRIRAYIEAEQVKKAVVIGGSFIGLEAADNLRAQGAEVTVLDLASQLLPNVLDAEMADYVRRHLQKQGVRVMTGVGAEKLLGDGRVTAVQAGGSTLPAELVVLSAGIRPNTAFLASSGIELYKGAILVDECLRTSLPDVYAAGDCVIVTNRLTGRRQWSPMGSSANLEGRTLAQVLAGRDKTFPGVLGTGVVRLPGLNCGRTGLTERQAREAGYDAVTVLAVTDDKAHYYPDASFFATKLIADRQTRRLLGIQVLGPGAVDKLVDIAVMAIQSGAVLEDLENADFAYAPPFSTAIHPLVQAVHILQNKLSGALVSMTPAEYAAGAADGYRVIDVSPVPDHTGRRFCRPDVGERRAAGHRQGGEAPAGLRAREAGLFPAKPPQTIRLSEHRGAGGRFVLQRGEGEGRAGRRLARGKNAGEGAGLPVRQALAGSVQRQSHHPQREDHRRGKHRPSPQAAERFGSGELAMTSRLTVEIQGVPFDNIEPLREFLAQAGLETGGTGSKVRPVVSCKGTTCQYGLIDTFALSEEIHERFYHGLPRGQAARTSSKSPSAAVRTTASSPI